MVLTFSLQQGTYPPTLPIMQLSSVVCQAFSSYLSGSVSCNTYFLLKTLFYNFQCDNHDDITMTSSAPLLCRATQAHRTVKMKAIAMYWHQQFMQISLPALSATHRMSHVNQWRIFNTSRLHSKQSSELSGDKEGSALQQ